MGKARNPSIANLPNYWPVLLLKLFPLGMRFLLFAISHDCVQVLHSNIHVDIGHITPYINLDFYIKYRVLDLQRQF